MTYRFSLPDDPWLSIAPASGGPAKEYSLRTALRDAHELGELVVSLPTQRPALLRQLLLPVVMDAGSPPGRAGVGGLVPGRPMVGQTAPVAGRLPGHVQRSARSLPP
ncbi:type I-E CRISPR-associated protein Cse1/CasA [Streptomyces sp. UNOC14_S4]|uniref:type I-E CRISPR-associated protein Cse1/CasA n=1 Tax=Streptomyces sp. UNOC14_S4 TaxID=2872340 RepID=UPI001E45B541|nr:type I-E CRISPR-associated protein Cse1/CasA [Streptomyces sp. UNOC14_S4]